MIQMIAFDADDTLWHNEIHYQEAQESLTQILAPWANADTVKKQLYDIEMQNLALYGYGVKAFVLSMIETAIQLSKGSIQGRTISEILLLGQGMLDAEVIALPYVTETLAILSKTHRMMVITKGDPLDQNNKIDRSGLSGFFAGVEVVSEKSSAAYQKILENYRLDIEKFLMVGNSLRSDILPVLELGGKAVYVPADATWSHENLVGFDTSQKGYYEIEHLGQLPGLVSRLKKDSWRN